MKRLMSELRDIHQQLTLFLDSAKDAGMENDLIALEQSTNTIGKAWSGSWAGHHANVYYENLTIPPAGRYFSSEWGFLDSRLNSNFSARWQPFNFDDLKKIIVERAGNPNVDLAIEIATKSLELFDEKRDAIVSILETAIPQEKDFFINRLKDEALNLRVISIEEYIAQLRPSQAMTRDTLASFQGIWTPAHIFILGQVASLRSTVNVCDKLAKIALKAASHLERLTLDEVRAKRIGTNVFIGHGRSTLWRELKDFIQDRLKLPWDEFNRVPVAGVTNTVRLSNMLDQAAVAFLIMTAEDDQADGTRHARMNVIHEAGLFQGRLGFARAVIIMEEGCDEFSNINGLGHIKFPVGNISAAFEEIRRFLEQEGLV